MSIKYSHTGVKPSRKIQNKIINSVAPREILNQYKVNLEYYTHPRLIANVYFLQINLDDYRGSIIFLFSFNEYGEHNANICKQIS